MTGPMLERFPSEALLLNPVTKVRFLLRRVGAASIVEEGVFRHDKRGKEWDGLRRDEAVVLNRTLECQIFEAFLISEVTLDFPRGMTDGLEEVRVEARCDDEPLFKRSLPRHLASPSQVKGRPKIQMKALRCSPEISGRRLGPVNLPRVDATEPELGIFCPTGTRLKITLTRLPVEASLDIRCWVKAALYTSQEK